MRQDGLRPGPDLGRLTTIGKFMKKLSTGVSVSMLMVLVWGCNTTPVAHAPVMEIGDLGDEVGIRFAGRVEALGPCEVLYPVDGPDEVERVSLNIETPESIDVWMDLAHQAAFQMLQSDPWGSWLQLGRPDPTPQLGVELIGRRTGSTDICAGERIPRVEVDQMTAFYDLDEEETIEAPVGIYLAGRAFDPEDEDVRIVLESGLAALQGQHRELQISVEGTYGEDCPCPAWRLDEPDVGFVTLQFAEPGLAPDGTAVLAELLADEDVDQIEQLNEEDAADIREEVAERTRAIERDYQGHFTGEVRFEIIDNHATAAPVFLVTGNVQD